MSRSRRKHPIIGHAGGSEKEDKQIANRKFRKVSKDKLKKGLTTPSRLREVSNNWDFAKDGKTYVRDLDDKYMRK